MMRIRTDGVARLGLFPGVLRFSPLDVNDQITIVSGIKLRASHLLVRELGLTLSIDLCLRTNENLSLILPSFQ